jgi:DNA invertase Pin-like site-specific DNA recombinase
MTNEGHEKVTASHLRRAAYLYVRQSTVRQVFENSESTERQYALRRRAVNLGWTDAQVVVIDSDLGISGASSTDREGFQKLVAEVGLGRAGIVLGLEVSRLARNSTDWHRLLELCALADTLILDEDGIYDPSHFNDRLLLGLKGTMSEAELHMIRARLRGGLINKARRGELRCPLPIGFVHDADARVVLDPDRQIRESVTMLFETFAKTGSVSATVRHFRKEGLLFPTRVGRGARKGEVTWAALSVGRAASALHNPWYAGAYVYGRTRHRKKAGGGVKKELLPKNEWIALIPDNHPGYIPWEEHERIERRLKENEGTTRWTRHRGPPREGLALLQGRAVCGLCGARMHVNYSNQKDQAVPIYVCVGRGRAYGDPACQRIRGNTIDAAIDKLVVDTVTPKAIELALAVQQEITDRIDQADRLRHRHVERAQYEADRARHRYMQVEPTHRLVAESLEAEWNAKLRALAVAKETVEKERSADRLVPDDDQRDKLFAVVQAFPEVWHHPDTAQRDRKRILGLIIEDATLIQDKQITVAVRFRGGATTTLTLPRPLTAQQQRATDPLVRKQIDELFDEFTHAQVAHILNERGLHTGAGEPFDRAAIKWVQHVAKIRSLKQRLLEDGWVTGKDLRARLGVGRTTLARWRAAGRITARICTDCGEWIYWPPDETNAPPPRGVGNPIARGAV